MFLLKIEVLLLRRQKLLTNGILLKMAISLLILLHPKAIRELGGNVISMTNISGKQR
jgi:hypothetical protein